MAPADTAREAAQAARRGFTEHKLKARPWDIVEQAQAISAATGPGYLIDVDPNFAFETLEQSLKLADQLARFPIRCFEDPFNWRPDFAGYAEFRARSSIRLAPHVGRASDVLKGIQAGAADLFNLDGLLARARHGAAVAEAAGLPVWLQTSSLSLGILGAYALHVAATIPNYTVPGDMRHFLKEHDLLVGRPIDPREGYIDLPNGPGLGVELDETALTRYCVGTITVEAE
jgi:L-alanine-DL-glutamate epimerase-like enolase superfamily enzyme